MRPGRVPAAATRYRRLQASPHRRPRRVRSSAGAGDPPQQHKRRVFEANIKSQIKRNKTNEKARLRNRAVKSELKTYTRKVKAAVSTGDAEVAGEALKTASRKLDKAVSKGVIHRNQAANRKSGLAKLVADATK